MNTDLLIRSSEGDLFVGETPEQIQVNFPSLSLAQVHGANVYYLEHQDELDARLADEDRTLDGAHAENRDANATFLDGMRARVETMRSR